jgi:hypothetical protein
MNSASVPGAEMSLYVKSLDDVSFRSVPGGLVVHWPCGESQSSVSSCCDYPPPVCGQGSGHIGHGRIIRWTENTRDASFKENHSGTARSGTHILGSPLRLSLAIALYSREQADMSGVHWLFTCSVVAETTLSLPECNINY